MTEALASWIQQSTANLGEAPQTGQRLITTTLRDINRICIKCHFYSEIPAYKWNQSIVVQYGLVTNT